jgi:hypothetical protein
MDLSAWLPACPKYGSIGRSKLIDESKRRGLVAQEILKYLFEHPAAADSAEGIRSWWLGDVREMSLALVIDVLDEMVERRLLVTHGNKSETRIYALNATSEDANG